MSTTRRPHPDTHKADSSSGPPDNTTAITIAQTHDANRRHWEAIAPEYKRRDQDESWRRCHQEPHLAFEGQMLETLLDLAGDLRGKKVCVVGSGDNYAAFALAGLGADVTSVDISEQQLQIAATRATELGLQIRFVRADAASLRLLTDNDFDLVCSTNGFFVWLADLSLVFSEIARILKAGGYYAFYDVHPFQRPWKDQVEPIEMVKPYWDTAPHEPSADETVCRYHWTLADILNALAEAGLRMRKVVESPAANSRFWEGPSYGPGTDESLQDWRHNPRAGLPVWLTVAAVKPFPVSQE